MILTDFYAIQTPFVWHILGAYFLQIWGVGVVRIIIMQRSEGIETMVSDHGLGRGETMG